MIKFNEVTWYSKLAAVLFFIGVLPILTFYIGVQYQKTNSILTTDIQKNPEQKNNIDLDTENKISYETVEINNFKIPQIKNFHNNAIEQKVNNYLTDVAKNSTCSDVPSSGNNYYNLDMKVSYAKNDIFSISIHSSWYCSGPYPTNDSNNSLTFDMKTGEVVPFAKLFSNYEKDRKTIMSLIFSEQIQKTSGAPSDQSCNGIYSMKNEGRDTGDYFKSIDYNIESSGLSGQPSFPHVIEACSEIGYVSIEQLRPYFDSSSLLGRVN